MVILIYGSTMGLSAGLLFWIQPLVIKTLLPTVGGAPAIWHTAIVFFQVVLLLGYSYAHWISRWLPRKRPVICHLILLAIAGTLLPNSRQAIDITIDASNPARIPLALWLGLAQAVGLPCLLLASTSPLLQSWFARTRSPHANDPYFLYTASNAGSLLALLGFPLLTEPYLNLSVQYQIWSAGFVCFAILVAIAQRFLAKPHLNSPIPENPDQRRSKNSANRPPQNSRPRTWLSLSFVGSSLMLGATTYLTTEVLNAPLIAILPLTAFLITFIIAFSPRSQSRHLLAHRLLPLSVLAVLFQFLTNSTDPAWLVIILHLGLVFSGCLCLHSNLVETLPSHDQVTNFYLWISLGGVIAGLLHTFVAPLVFNQVWEYPIAIVATALMHRSRQPDKPGKQILSLPAGSAILGLALFLMFSLAIQRHWILPSSPPAHLLLASALLAIYVSNKDRSWFATGIASLLLIDGFRRDAHGETLFIDRNFFGLSRVTLDPTGLNKRLIHGNTIHGRQGTSPNDSFLPLSYYHVSGPLNRIFRQYDVTQTEGRVGVVGLGAGCMVFYREEDAHWTFYEIDPLVISIARDSGHFTYLEGLSEKTLQIVQGDARISLMKAPDGNFDLIILDAFSGDSIPTHLLTIEALKGYLGKLAPNGLLAFHISNRTLTLEPILSRLAEELGLQSLSWNDSVENKSIGKDPSHWAVLARDRALFSKLLKDERWQPLEHSEITPLWTDEKSSLFDAIDWRQ
jgi:hypothetical protein